MEALADGLTEQALGDDHTELALGDDLTEQALGDDLTEDLGDDLSEQGLGEEPTLLPLLVDSGAKPQKAEIIAVRATEKPRRIPSPPSSQNQASVPYLVLNAL